MGEPAVDITNPKEMLTLSQVIEQTCDKHMSELIVDPTLEDIVQTDAWARQCVSEIVNSSSVPV